MREPRSSGSDEKTSGILKKTENPSPTSLKGATPTWKALSWRESPSFPNSWLPPTGPPVTIVAGLRLGQTHHQLQKFPFSVAGLLCTHRCLQKLPLQLVRQDSTWAEPITAPPKLPTITSLLVPTCLGDEGISQCRPSPCHTPSWLPWHGI